MSIEALSQRTLEHLEVIRALKNTFTVTRRAEEFLFTHSTLRSILQETRRHVETIFGISHLILDVAENESGEAYKLFLQIPVDLSPEEANQKLNEFDENWTLNHMDELEDIVIDVVYR